MNNEVVMLHCYIQDQKKDSVQQITNIFSSSNENTYINMTDKNALNMKQIQHVTDVCGK
jgi:hypothetical protein